MDQRLLKLDFHSGNRLSIICLCINQGRPNRKSATDLGPRPNKCAMKVS
jgi:hypothetical protein